MIAEGSNLGGILRETRKRVCAERAKDETAGTSQSFVVGVFVVAYPRAIDKCPPRVVGDVAWGDPRRTHEEKKKMRDGSESPPDE